MQGSSTSTRLTKKQTRFLKAIPESDSLTEAAIKAGYSKKWPAAAANQSLREIQQKAPLVAKAALDKHGASIEDLIEKHLIPTLKAKSPYFVTHEGQITEERQIPAWTPRVNALDIALKLHGAYPRNGHSDPDTPQSGAVTVNLAVFAPDRAAAVIASVEGSGVPAVLDDEVYENEG